MDDGAAGNEQARLFRTVRDMRFDEGVEIGVHHGVAGRGPESLQAAGRRRQGAGLAAHARRRAPDARRASIRGIIPYRWNPSSTISAASESACRAQRRWSVSPPWPTPAACSSTPRRGRARISRATGSPRATTTASPSRTSASPASRCWSRRRTSATLQAASASGTAPRCSRCSSRARREHPVAVVLLLASGGVRLHEANAAELALARVLRTMLDARVEGVAVLAIGAGHVFGGTSVLACAADRLALLPGSRIGLSGPAGARVRRTASGRSTPTTCRTSTRCSAPLRAAMRVMSSSSPTMPTWCVPG